MNHEFMDALEQVEREKGISKVILLDAIETALASAYKRDQKVAQSIEVRIDPDTGAFRVYTHKTVVDGVEDDKNEISLADAQKINPIYELGDLVEFEIFPKEFGRIAAQTAKQVVVQRIREAERSIIYDEFVNRVGDLITGIVQRFEQKNIFIDLGRIEGILPGNEQMPNEHYEQGMRLKTFVVEVKKTTKGPQVLLSRSRIGLLKRLFELEVPEIQDGLVEIKSVAREPGHRSKLAVYSRDSQIDPVGACVGSRGIRVQMIVRELKGEKIDVIPWSTDPITFIINALSPAKVSDVKILPSKKTAIVIVPDFQLSLAIGKEGQNARLAAKLTGWKIDIKSESQAAERTDEIDRLVREEIGFKEIVKEEELQEQESLANVETVEDTGDAKEIEADKNFEEKPALPEKIADTEEEIINLPVTPLEDEEDEEPEEPEEFNPKKKVKKVKSSQPKHLAKLELEDEPISEDEGFFFADVLDEKSGKSDSRSDLESDSSGDAEKNEAQLQNDVITSGGKKTKTKNSVKVDETGSQDEDFSGFTIGQLLGAELNKEKAGSGKGRKKGDS
ncbi:MAG TPA: transcription termination/antitermination protein NusA [Firmicutes bacterium]|jgi:transcription termination/antitermination protein NusA|nr:transcription termination/antitermination protein NusA [Bacillota bacterium]